MEPLLPLRPLRRGGDLGGSIHVNYIRVRYTHIATNFLYLGGGRFHPTIQCQQTMGSRMEITIPSRKHGPRVLRPVGTVLHQQVSGEMITLSVFRAECMKCQTRFYITAPGDVCDDIVPKSFGYVHCTAHRQWTTDNAIRRHAELAECFDTEDERTGRQLVWDGSLSIASWSADAGFPPGLEGWLLQSCWLGSRASIVCTEIFALPSPAILAQPKAGSASHEQCLRV
jgi:hypothetical protein